MNDRELLELAAKAAGIKVIRSRLEDPLNKDMLVTQSYRNPFQHAGPWSPLSDDGDALRLAVKLRLSPMMRTLGCDTTDLNGTAGAYEKWGGDPYAATRRAIVRAAAEIGRQMQEGGAE